MKVTLVNKEELVRELSVEIPVERVNELVEKKLVEKRATVELKGFRKGKAPMNVIRSNYGEEIKFQAAEDLLKETYPEAVKQQELKVASFPEVTKLDYNEDGSLYYIANVEVFPEIDKIEVDGLKIQRDKIEVADDEVNDIVEMMRKKSATVRVVDRPANDNDIVVLDIIKLEDPGEVLKTDKFDNSEVDLNNKLTIKEFKDNIPGMKAGEVKEIDVVYADDYPDKLFAGAKLKYKCTVKEVKEQILPEVNDAFAKTSGQAETLLELRLKIRENLEHQKKDDQDRSEKTQVIDHVSGKNEIPVPKALVEEYINNIVKDFKERYKDQPIEEDEIRKNYEPVGTTTIRWNMLMHKLADIEKIEVVPSDIDNLIQKFADNYKITLEQAKQSLQQSGNIADIRESILEDKVIDFIKSKAKIISADK